MAKVFTAEERAVAIAAAERRVGLDGAPSVRLTAVVNGLPGGGEDRLDLAASGAPTKEKGFAGLPSWGGIASGEIDSVDAWKTPQRWATIKKMEGDPDVGAVFRAIALPILAVPFRIIPGSDAPEDRQIAEFLERDMNNMTVSLAKHRAQALKMTRWGNRLFETVFTRGEDKLFHLRKLALRPSATIQDWHLDDNGGPDGVTQVLGNGRTERLDMERLLGFVYGDVDFGLIGEPLSRAMYGSWLLKTTLAKVGAVAVERHGTGMPTLLYRGSNPENRRRYESMLQGVHAHEKAFVLLAEGVMDIGDFSIKGVDGSVMDPVAQMEYHRRGVYAAGMAMHMLLGSESVGSHALSEDQSSNFLLGEMALIQEMEDTYNRYLFPRWVGYNWPRIPSDRMPRASHGTLARRDVGSWFEALTHAVNAGVRLDADLVNRMAGELLGVGAVDLPGADITPVGDVNAGEEAQDDPTAPGQADEKDGLSRRVRSFAGVTLGEERTQQANSLRARKHLADKCSCCGGTKGLTVHHIAPGDDNNAPDQLQTVCKACHDEWSGYTQNGGGNKRITARALEAYRKGANLAASGDLASLPSVQLLAERGIEVLFVELGRRMDLSQASLEERLDLLQRKQARRVATQVGKLIDAGDPEAIQAWLEDEANIPYEEERDALEQAMRTAWLLGNGDAYGEMAQQGYAPSTPAGGVLTGAAALLGTAAALGARQLATRMGGAVGTAALDQLRAGASNVATLRELAGVTGSTLLRSVAGRAINFSTAVGRTSMIRENAPALSGVLWSSALDAGTCKPCFALEGKIFPEAQAPRCPYIGCKGGWSCRCMTIPVVNGKFVEPTQEEISAWESFPIPEGW